MMCYKIKLYADVGPNIIFGKFESFSLIVSEIIVKCSREFVLTKKSPTATYDIYVKYYEMADRFY